MRTAAGIEQARAVMSRMIQLLPSSHLAIIPGWAYSRPDLPAGAPPAGPKGLDGGEGVTGLTIGWISHRVVVESVDADSGAAKTGVFFFRAEDGIRGLYVTGVQTCALPICPEGQLQRRRLRADARLPAFLRPELAEPRQRRFREPAPWRHVSPRGKRRIPYAAAARAQPRSEERRVGRGQRLRRRRYLRRQQP